MRAGLQLALRDAREKGLQLLAPMAEVAADGVHEEIADGEHVEAAHLVVFAQHAADLVLRDIARRDDLTGEDQDGGGPLGIARGAHGLRKGPGAAVGSADHVLRAQARREPEHGAQSRRDQADVHPLVRLQPRHRGDEEVGEGIARPPVVAAEEGVQRAERAVRRGGEEVVQAHRLGDAEVALPVLGAGAAVVAPVGEAEEEPRYFLAGQLGERMGKEVPLPPLAREVARIGAVLAGHHEDAPPHAVFKHVCGGEGSDRVRAP